MIITWQSNYFKTRNQFRFVAAYRILRLHFCYLPRNTSEFYISLPERTSKSNLSLNQRLIAMKNETGLEDILLYYA